MFDGPYKKLIVWQKAEKLVLSANLNAKPPLFAFDLRLRLIFNP